MTMRKGLFGHSCAAAGAATAARAAAVKARRRIVPPFILAANIPCALPGGQSGRRFRLSMKITVVIFRHDQDFRRSGPPSHCGSDSERPPGVHPKSETGKMRTVSRKERN